MSAILFAVALLAGGPAHAQAQTSSLTYPVNGSSNVDLSQPFQWTSVANAQAYYLYVGTSPGTNNLVNTGEIQSTSYLASNLPGNQTLYARMWVEVAGVWRYTDSTFTGAAVARLTFPANGAVNADMTQAIQWTSVANVQTYYLYVGTTAGANDLVNTGEILATSYQATDLPSGQTLYARLWTAVAGVWRYTDTTFTAASSVSVKATLTYPADGYVNANMTQPIQWTSIPNAQTYYLYVGTTAGASDVVDSGELQTTSYEAAGLPVGRTLYARIWTKVANVWRYNDTTFTAGVSNPLTATLTYPLNDGVYAALSQPFQWTSVVNAQSYYLYVGTTAGANDLVNSGELQNTSYQVSGLPSEQTLYVRMWAQVGGVWRYTDATFRLSTTATLLYPQNGATNIDQARVARWTRVVGAEWYYLYVGSTPGADDLISSNEIQDDAYSIAGLPVGSTLYARLWTRIAGVWRYSDSTFTAGPLFPQFINPTDGAVGVDGTQPFRWTAPPNRPYQQLLVGTSPGANDLFDSGVITATTVSVGGLPTGTTLYARVLSSDEPGATSVWWHTDIAFTLDSTVAPSTILTPTNGAAAFDTVQPFQWASVPLARGYRLKIGSTAGGSDLHDSGEIHVTRRFVPNLPLGLLFGRLETKINGQWQSQDFTFTVTANTTSAAVQMQHALWATGHVRDMASSDSMPFSWTELAATVPARRGFWANCTDYAAALLQVFSEMNISLTARRLDVALNPNGSDAHTLVEMFNPDTARWLLLDPTFGLTVRRASDGTFATAEELSAATNAQQWNAVTYEFVTTAGDAWARNYYIDYPLLFVNVYHAGQTPVNGQGNPVLPYLQEVSLPYSGSQAVVGRCFGQSSWAVGSGNGGYFPCTGVDNLTRAFVTSGIADAEGALGTQTLNLLKRYVFIP